MVRKINENVQLIHIGPNTALTSTAISYALMRARSNYMYAKFYTDKFFIQVNFMRDGTISVSSNIRNPAYVNDMWKKSQIGWTFSSVKEFIYKWMQISRRNLS